MGNADDNRPFAANDDQADADADGLGDACDVADNRDIDGEGESEPSGDGGCSVGGGGGSTPAALLLAVGALLARRRRR